MADDTSPDDAPEDAPAPEPNPASGQQGGPPAGESEPMEQHDALLALLKGAGFNGNAIVETADAHGGLVVRVANAQWKRAAEVAKEHLACDYLSFISGIDWQPAPREGDEAGGDSSAPVQPTEMTFGAAGSAGRFQVFAHVQSTTKHWGVTFKTDVDDADPRVESWVPVYAGADWHERECWEMYGFTFDGHPSLRHLYLPFEFEGHPLRKDYSLLARFVKPWPGLVDVEPMPGEPAGSESPEGSAGVTPAESSEPLETGEA
ncbi:MAG: NADH-quinone oxidoreductase subunit C [Acidimicrobiia bacterium]